MEIFNISQESLWLVTVVYDLGLALLLYRFFGKYGLYVAVVLGIVLGNLQGGKVSELIIFGTAYKVSMERKNFKAIEVSDIDNLSAEKVFERLSNSLF